jgi:hypothetical protein
VGCGGLPNFRIVEIVTAKLIAEKAEFKRE